MVNKDESKEPPLSGMIANILVVSRMFKKENKRDGWIYRLAVPLLVFKGDASTRYWVAELSTDLNARTFTRLAQDNDTEIRVVLASRPDIPQDIAEQLALDPQWVVRERISINDNVSEKIRTIAGLTSHDERIKHETIAKTLGRTPFPKTSDR